MKYTSKNEKRFMEVRRAATGTGEINTDIVIPAKRRINAGDNKFRRIWKFLY
ncbi:MAG: hypothetical protein PF545_03095 [Elusimicrobia bacterium]|nr:hypothetical protein [Elusimicrobiota bacterium]